MKERIVEMIEKKPYVSTVHSFASAFLREFAPKGFTKSFRIVEGREQFYIIKNLVKKYGLNQHPRYIIEKLTLIRNLRDCKMLKREGLEEFYNNYFHYLRNNNSIDFDGLLTLCLDTLKNNPTALEAYRRKFKYILVDEFQDISPLQYEIIKLLAKGCGNLLCVGDLDQGVFSFIGANVNIMLNFKSDFPQRQLYYLEQNYRSTKKIVEAANTLIKNNPNRQDKPHWTDRLEGSAPHIEHLADCEGEAQYIASIIKEGISKGKRYSHYAVLYRINSLSQVLESIFSGQGIPYQVVDGAGYFERTEIKDILSFFKLAANPADNTFFNDVCSVLSRINDVPFKKYRGSEVLIERAHQSKTEFIRELPALVQELSAQDSLVKIYNLILSHTGYLQHLKKDASSIGERRVKNVEALEVVIKNLSNDINNFLKLIEDTQAEKENDSVKFLTIHSAKGLEFDTVFIIGAADGMLPYYKNTSPEEVEEERRMFYVAVTRAKNTLYITYPEYDGRDYKRPSPFIYEIKKPVPKAAVSSEQITLGGLIYHEKFGAGKVVFMGNDHEKKNLITIKFQDAGNRTFFLEDAPLKVI